MTNQSSYNADAPHRRIKGINTTGLMTLAGKEIGRFMNVYTQTLLSPVVTTLLFFIVFALAFDGGSRMVGEVSYLVFLAPGLLMMTMAQNAFANTSSSLVISKVQGNIVDVLMPPLSPGELLAGYVIGGVVRGLMVGVTTWIAISVFVGIFLYSLPVIIIFAVLGMFMLSLMGVAAGLWSEKFDHMAAVTNFFVTPMTFLSGTFYAVSTLPAEWQFIAHLNPFFYMIDGFRFGFTGYSDGNVMAGAAVLTGVNFLLALACYLMFRSGYKLKS
jgi:ABC-2 type transport system permease protein